MRDLYQAFAEARKLNRERGFTLIELLVVIAIIAILAAIAIPQFAKYRLRAFNSAAESDLRNIRTTMEAVFADYQTYGTVSINNGNQNVTIADSSVGFNETVGLSSGVYVDLYSNVNQYLAGSVNQKGDRKFCADSDVSNLYWNTVNIGTTDPGISDAGSYGQNDCSGTPL